MNIEQINQKLAGFSDRKRQINANADLSPEGKRKGLQALDAEAIIYRADVLRDLGRAWGEWKADARRNVEALQAANNRAAGEWDYNRLQYAARAVGNAIAQADNFAAIAKAYKQAQESGDRHTLRAWIETSGAAVLRRFGRDPEAVTWAKRLDQDAQTLESDEVKQLKAEGQALTERGAQLDEQTQRVRSFYQPYGAPPLGVSDDWERLAEGVKITRKLNVETLATETQISLVD